MPSHPRSKKQDSLLREPLYRAPPGSPQLDPGIDTDLAQIRRTQPQYLPPYRYDKDEDTSNIYRTSDEAYSTVAKLLAYEYDCCKHTYSAHHVIEKNLTPTQRKFFADAHMEREDKISKGYIDKAPISKLVKEIDAVFGMVFLEYFVSKDGNLSPAQKENLNRVSSPGFDRNIQATIDKNEGKKLSPYVDGKHQISEKFHIPGTPLASNTTLVSVEEQINDNIATDIQDPQETSFDDLYNNISTKEDDTNKSSTMETTSISRTNETQTSRTKLRQELLREIMQISKLLRHEKDQEQRATYEMHLDNLRAKFNTYVELGPKVKDSVLVIEVSQNRIKTDEKIVAGFKDTPREEKAEIVLDFVESPKEHTDTRKELEFEYEVASRCLSKGENTSDASTTVDSELKFISIVAPMSMIEGHLFEAEYNNKKFRARIPKGGVQKGQLFTTPMLNPSGASGQYFVYDLEMKTMDVPKGSWRDGFFSCCKDPLFFMSCVFPHAALSQIRSRMQLLSEGEMSSPALGTKFLIFFTIALLSLNAWTVVALIFIVNSPQLWLILSCTIPLGLLDIFVVGTLIMKTIRTRKAVREYFDIEEQNCNGSEDAFLGFFCACCTISQMGRHTADYATYREDIFSPTGLPSKLEMIVPTQTIKDRDSEQSIHSF